MADDLYTRWLGVPPGSRPPDHYTLLRLPPGAGDAREIQQAASEQLQRLAEAAHGGDAQQQTSLEDLRRQINEALDVLMDPYRHGAYDQSLRDRPTGEHTPVPR